MIDYFNKTMIDKLFTELLSDRALYENDDPCNSCLMKLIDMDAIIDTVSYPRIITLPTHMFWHYISKNGFLITTDLILLTVSEKINDDVQDYVFNRWLTDTISLREVATVSWAHPQRRYVAKLMQTIHTHFDCDKIMMQVMIKSGSVVNVGALWGMIKFIGGCDHYDELRMLYLILMKMTGCSNLFNYEHREEVLTLDAFIESDADAKNIYIQIKTLTVLNDSDFYRYGFDEIIKNLRLLLNIC